jgi:PASTA domain
MGDDMSPWQDGRRAWERLTGWHQDSPSAAPGHPDDGADALTALADVGLVRRLLDQAELVAVRTARRHGKSWAEIATMLGVTRQSAWERWRELDDPAGEQPTGRAPSVPRFAPPEVVASAPWNLRRRSSTVVPNVVGMSCDDARQVLRQKGLSAVGPDRDGPSLADLGWPDGVVTDQSPESGAKVPVGSSVRLWVERGGGSGVREPRRPSPAPKTSREWRDQPIDQPSDEAVG